MDKRIFSCDKETTLCFAYSYIVGNARLPLWKINICIGFKTINSINKYHNGPNECKKKPYTMTSVFTLI